MELGNDKQKRLIENLPDAFAYTQVITADDGSPVDCIFLEVNAAFEEMSEFDWICTWATFNEIFDSVKGISKQVEETASAAE